MFSDPHELLGRRYATDFRVVAIAANGETGVVEATLLMHGDLYRISMEELLTIIERGFVAELPPLGGVT